MTKKIKCQERTYCFLSDSITCINCIHNLNPVEITHGRRIKDFCNIHKQEFKNPNDPSFTSFDDNGRDSDEYELHIKALECSYYLPDLINVGFVLNEGKYLPLDIVKEVSDKHAEGISMCYPDFDNTYNTNKPIKE